MRVACCLGVRACAFLLQCCHCRRAAPSEHRLAPAHCKHNRRLADTGPPRFWCGGSRPGARGRMIAGCQAACRNHNPPTAPQTSTTGTDASGRPALALTFADGLRGDEEEAEAAAGRQRARIQEELFGDLGMVRFLLGEGRWRAPPGGLRWRRCLAQSEVRACLCGRKMRPGQRRADG